MKKNLKPIPKSNKGLPKLPKAVRNKMGFMKRGGMVKGSREGSIINTQTSFKKGGLAGRLAMRGYGKAR
tara:strand:- start:414 stop:620 length:207 start_codon:yes stop_codon:yes gene_type:complete